jgi:hypothetical protein
MIPVNEHDENRDDAFDYDAMRLSIIVVAMRQTKTVPLFLVCRKFLRLSTFIFIDIYYLRSFIQT